MLVTGNRFSDSKVLCSILFFDLMPDEHLTLNNYLFKEEFNDTGLKFLFISDSPSNENSVNYYDSDSMTVNSFFNYDNKMEL